MAPKHGQGRWAIFQSRKYQLTTIRGKKRNFYNIRMEHFEDYLWKIYHLEVAKQHDPTFVDCWH